MAVTAYASGSQTASVGTEHFLSSPNVAGTYTFHVNSLNMVAGDVLELRIYQMILTGDTPEIAFYGQFSGIQNINDRIKVSPPISNELTDTNALRFSLTQVTGAAGRVFKWKVLNHA